MSKEPALDGSQDLRGYGQNDTAYGAYGRFETYSRGTIPPTNTPQFTCPRGEDKLTVENGGLSKKIGLITADEVVAAGASTDYSNSYYHYLNKSSNIKYWSLSPDFSHHGYAHVFGIAEDGYLLKYEIFGYVCAVAPVINLSAEYAKQLEGTGIIGDEYKLPSGV